METENKCGNCTGITLLWQTFKIYERILVHKITLEIKKLVEQQYTFRKERATTNLSFGIRQLIQKN
jgi:hypothetical protein